MTTAIKLEEMEFPDEDPGDPLQILEQEQKPIVMQCLVCQKSIPQNGPTCQCSCPLEEVVTKTKTPEPGFQCQHCPKILATPKGLKNHQKLHLGIKPYKCNHCTMSFTQAHRLKIHTLQHTGSRPYSCIFCQKGYTRKRQLFIHLQGHVGEKPNECHICGRGFVDGSALSKHIQCHMGSLPERYTCKHCNKKFHAKNHYDDHLRVHTNERPYKCDLCPDKAYKQNSALNHHKRTFHLGVLPFQCKICKKGFGTSHQLYSHVNHVHRPEDEGNVKCEICSREFKHLIRLKKHMFTVHNEGAKLFQCSSCPKTFPDRHTLTRHTAAVHLGIRKRGRPCCGFRKAPLSTQAPILAPEEIWQCKHCAKKFCCKLSMERHAWRYHVVKRWECPFCKRMYSESRAYEVHLRSYLGEKPVFCQECDHESPTPETGERHMINEHGQEKRYPCPKCGKKFVCAGEVRSHLKYCKT